MALEHFREHYLLTKGTTEKLPFDENVLVFKVLMEIFAFCNMMTCEITNLKYDPENAITLK